MAAFAYINPEGSRFSDGSFGVYYAARTLATAVAECVYHRELFMRRTKEPPMRLDMRVLTATLNAEMHDIRGMKSKFKKVYSRKNYSESRSLAVQLRQEGSFGIAYDSVRDPGGECLAVFRPKALDHCRRERHMIFEWNGKKIAKVFQLQEFISEDESP